MKLAIPAAVFGAVGTAGQRCTSLRRLFIHESIYDLVKEKMVNAYKQVKVGNPLDQANLMGPLIDQAAVDNFTRTVEQAINQGGKVLTGGKSIAKPGFLLSRQLSKPIIICQSLLKRTFVQYYT